MTSIEIRKASLLARTNTATLLESAIVLESLPAKKPEHRMTAAWILDELERRVGVITDAEEPEFERIYDETDSYIAALMALRPALKTL